MSIELGLALSLASNLINRLPDLVINEVGKTKNVDDTLLSLIILVHTIQRKLDQHVSEELTKPKWRPWVRKLTENFSEAEDEIDAINLALKKLNHQQSTHDQTTTLWSRFKNKSPTPPNKNPVRDSLSSFKKMGVPNKINTLLNNFKRLEEELNKIMGDAFKGHREVNLTEPIGTRLSCLCRGQVNITRKREEEKAIVIHKYLLDLSRNERGVSILGMAGSGKTTLARSIQRDDSIKRYFCRVIWGSVPGNFNSKANIFFHDGEGQAVNNVTIDSLRQYEGKTLLVLDDIWNVEHAVWRNLRSDFGSEVIILITTRDPRVAKITETHLYHIKRLSDTECKEIIDMELPSDALHQRDNNITYLAQKCADLPLVAKKLGQTIGSRCRTEESIEDAISRFEGIKDLWDLEVFRDAIFPPLKFNDPPLPSELRKCTAYMTLFPEGYNFKKDELPQLWLSEGFLQELITAGDYFDDLHWRSILQLPNHGQQDEMLTYQMHELFRGFARSMAFNTCHQVEEGKPPDSADHIRHLSIWCQTIEEHIFNTISKCCKRLKTFLLLHKQGSNIYQISESFFTELLYLRVVNVSNSRITSLPRSIRNLKHLRYLDASNTRLQTLNGKLCDLFGLQILRLKNCSNLLSLPEGIGRLVNLSFLDVDIQCLSSTPSYIGSLVNLQALEEYIVKQEKGKRISELENLNHLRGSIRIKGLENVKDGLEAKRANLIKKPHLKGVEFHWTKTLPNSSTIEAHSILTALQPNEGLQELKLMCYNGGTFPNWLTGATHDLKMIHLYDCPNIENLSMFGELPYLNNLFVDTLSKMERVERRFMGDTPEFERFAKLEILEFRNMENLSSWEEIVPGNFPSLRTITIMDCPKLILSPTFSKHLPIFTKTSFCRCGSAP